MICYVYIPKKEPGKKITERCFVFSLDHLQSCGDYSRYNGKETSYGDVHVTVCNGDITGDDCDVIVNGVINRDFDLSHGKAFNGDGCFLG